MEKSAAVHYLILYRAHHFTTICCVVVSRCYCITPYENSTFYKNQTNFGTTIGIRRCSKADCGLYPRTFLLRR